MEKKFLWLSILGVLISFAGGFLLANAFNRSEIERVQTENTRLQKAKDPESAAEKGFELSNKEIEAKIAEAESNQGDFAFQKGLGLALYRYSAVKGDKKLLDNVKELLERAYKINPDDYQVIVSLGNVHYDLGQINSEEENNLRAREFYARALEKNAKDTNVRTDYALTFLLTRSPDRKKAIAEFQKALSENPKNEKALAYISQAYRESGEREKVSEFVAKLREVNPKNPMLAELEGKSSSN